MSKDFKSIVLGTGLNKAPKPEAKNKGGRPQTNFKIVENASEKGTKEGETRATVIINKEILRDIKALAYWERLPIKDIIGRALETEVARCKEELGEIKPLPKKKK